MIDDRASFGVLSQLRNLDSLRLINKVGTIDLPSYPTYEKPLAKETLAGGFFILPAKSGASPKAIYA